MRKQVKIWSLLLMMVMVSSFAVALQEPVPQQAGTSNQVVIGAQDVITASDAGGGALSTRDLIIMIAIGVGIIILILAI